MKWISEVKKVPKVKKVGRTAARQRTPEEVRRLVLRIARETGWDFVAPVSAGTIRRQERLRGIIKHYPRATA